VSDADTRPASTPGDRAGGADRNRSAGTALSETAHVGTGPGEERIDYEPGPGTVVCEHCGRPFAETELLALHRGHAHPRSLTVDQREAFEAAYEAETDDLRRFQLKAAGLVVLLYFGFLMLYAAV